MQGLAHLSREYITQRMQAYAAEAASLAMFKGLFIMGRETRILFSLEVLSSGLEAHCREKSVQIVGDRLIEAVKLTNVCAGRGCDCQESEDQP